jgi:hypothetical protein
MENTNKSAESPKQDYFEVGRFDSYPEVYNDVKIKVEEMKKDGWRLPTTVELKNAVDNNSLGKDKFYWADDDGRMMGWSYGMADDRAHADPSREDGKEGPGVWLTLTK